MTFNDVYLQNDEERKVILFHYTEWPCHSNPFSNALLEFRCVIVMITAQKRLTILKISKFIVYMYKRSSFSGTVIITFELNSDGESEM